jgi:MFS family permease
MQPTKKARIGVVLATVGVVSAFLWWYSVGYLFQVWYQSHQISAIVFAALAVAPSVALAVVGLVGYIAGRKDFWKERLKTKGLLAVLGLVLMFVGGFFVAYSWSMSAYAANKSMQPLTYCLANNSPYFTLFVLWFMTGLLVFVDSLEAHWRKE